MVKFIKLQNNGPKLDGPKAWKSRWRVMSAMALRTLDEFPRLPLWRKNPYRNARMFYFYFFVLILFSFNYYGNSFFFFFRSQFALQLHTLIPIFFLLPDPLSWLASRGWADPPPSLWPPTLLTWPPGPWPEPWICPLVLPPISRSLSSTFSLTIATWLWLGKALAPSASIGSHGGKMDLDPRNSPLVLLPAALSMEI